MEKIYQTSVKRFSSHNPIVWGIASILFGILMIAWQGELLSMLVLTLGVISIIVGLVQFLSFLKMTKGMERRWSMFPVGTIIALVIGLALIITPHTWVNILMVLVGILVLLLGLSSISNLTALRRVSKISWTYFIFPVLQIFAGLLIVWNPIFLADFIVTFAGVWIILYGVFEFVGYFVIKSK